MVEPYLRFGIFSCDSFYEGSIVRKMFEASFQALPEIIETWGDEFKTISEKIKRISVSTYQLTLTHL